MKIEQRNSHSLEKYTSSNVLSEKRDENAYEKLVSCKALLPTSSDKSHSKLETASSLKDYTSYEPREDIERTELSDLFDPAALPTYSEGHSQSNRGNQSDSDEQDKENSKADKKNQFSIIKIKSPVKLLRRKKKTAKEDLDIFEEKENPKTIDLLDDDQVNSKAKDNDVLPFTSNSFSFNIPNKDPTVPFASINNISSPPPRVKACPRPDPIQEDDRKKSFDQLILMITSSSMSENENRPVSNAIPKPPTLKQDKRTKSIDKMMTIFSPRENADFDMNIGLRLAAKDKLDIMKGNTPIKGENSLDNDTPSKKLMVLPEKNILKKTLQQLPSISPFKKKNLPKSNKSADKKSNEEEITLVDPVLPKQEDSVILLRTSETEPSVHQTSLPEATDLLIHARICALMEGYDKLLETRAKAGKRWFSFGNLVGVSRKELENMYLDAIGQKPEIPLFIGEEQQYDEPPPLPSNLSDSHHHIPLGNPFGRTLTDGQSLNSIISATSNESTLNFPRKRSSAPSVMKPHPSTIKSLLECTDDLVVEGYFNETIGSDNDLIDAIESTSVQVSVFSSQRQRQFIVCYRGTIGQHAKPLRSKLNYSSNFIGVNEAFGDSYLHEMEENIFHLIEKLSSDNPFCDISFTGHSFGK